MNVHGNPKTRKQARLDARDYRTTVRAAEELHRIRHAAAEEMPALQPSDDTARLPWVLKMLTVLQFHLFLNGAARPWVRAAAAVVAAGVVGVACSFYSRGLALAGGLTALAALEVTKMFLTLREVTRTLLTQRGGADTHREGRQALLRQLHLNALRQRAHRSDARRRDKESQLK